MQYKLIILLIIYLTKIPVSFGGFWDVVLTELCSDGTMLTETWNGNTKTFDPYNLCTPYNRIDGRDEGTCLLQFDYPGTFTPFYVSHCIESTLESNFFDPKLLVRHQTCDTLACWSQNTTLSSDGECVIWPGPYALPMLRICARQAVPDAVIPNPDPAKPPKTLPPDPGYTYGVHINYQGVTEKDKTVYDIYGKPITVNRPKVCAYKDPSIFDHVLGMDGDLLPDLMDFKPDYQPIHNTGGVHPIAAAIIFIIQAGVSLRGALSALEENLLKQTVVLEPLALVMKALDWIVETVGDRVVDALKFIGQFNRLVDPYQFGCVEIPMGPYPPPYCPKMKRVPAMAKIQPICNQVQQDDGTLAIGLSTEKNQCVVSVLDNNIINNSFRIGFDRIIPICKNKENPEFSDTCVTLQGITSASALHTSSARRDLIHSCTTQSGGSCVNINSSIPEPAGGFRIVYSIKIASIETPSIYIEDSGQFTDKPQPIPDCPPVDVLGSPNICQKVYAINAGNFKDVTLSFPVWEDQKNAAAALVTSAPIELNDPDGDSRNINASIERIPTKVNAGTADARLQTPNQICATEGSKLVGCVERTLNIKPKVLECDGAIPSGGPQCTNDHYKPQFVAGVTIGKYNSYIVAEVPNVNDPNGVDSINLVGYDFNVYATDGDFNKKPFFPNGPNTHSFNSSSIYGTYKDKPPYDNTGKENTDAVYIRGLEYVNGKYIQGGTQACIEPKQSDKCPVNKKLCVLTNMLNTDYVSCADFNKNVSIYTNLSICNSDVDIQNCQQRGYVSGISGKSGLDILECPADSKNYCYQSPVKDKLQPLELCKPSIKPKDRKYPFPDNPTLSDSDFYDINNAYNTMIPATYLDPQLNSVRSKTVAELGLCVTIPQPQCAEIQEANADWPITDAGTIATGKCLPGYKPKDPTTELTRLCLADAKTMNTKFEALASGVECIQGGADPTFDFVIEDNSFNKPDFTTTLSKTETEAKLDVVSNDGVDAAHSITVKLSVESLGNVGICKISYLNNQSWSSSFSVTMGINKTSYSFKTNSESLDCGSLLQAGDNIIVINYFNNTLAPFEFHIDFQSK